MTVTIVYPSAAVALLAIVVAGAPFASRAHARQQAGRPAAPAPARDGATVRPGVGTSSIAGVVVSAEAQPKPVRRARVTLNQTEQGTLVRWIVPTDDEGRFAFSQLPAGRFSVSAARLGWVTTNLGARTPGGQGLTLALTEGQQIRNVTIAMSRGAVITGRVIDTAGQPVIGARVVISERRLVNGVATYQPTVTTLGNPTDDRGTYRAFGLRAGSYVVSVTAPLQQSAAGRMPTAAELQWLLSRPAPGTAPAPPPPPGQASVYAQVFYPGTADANAAALVTVATGEEREGIDIALQRVPVVRATGTVRRPDGQPASGAQILVTRLGQPVLDPFSSLVRFSSRSGANGGFTLSDLQPGPHQITALAASGTAPVPAATPGGRPSAPPLDLWATTELTVTGTDMDGLALSLQPGMTVSGRVAFEGGTPPPAGLNQVSVYFEPPASERGAITVSSFRNVVAADGSFSIKGLAPGSYNVTAYAPGVTAGTPTWVLKSAVMAGRSLLDGPVEIQPNVDLSDVLVTFTDKVTELSGQLLDQAGRPAPEFYVVVFATDATRWRPESRWLHAPTRPASDGRYRITALPPGEYYLAALTEFDENEWSTPAFLEQVVPGAIKITIGEGEKKTQDIRLGI